MHQELTEIMALRLYSRRHLPGDKMIKLEIKKLLFPEDDDI